MDDFIHKDRFDGCEFNLRFRSIDDIVQEIGRHGADMSLAKIDMPHAFPISGLTQKMC